MNLIKQFMKIGGFKTPEELEAYGEDNFFRDHPEARQLAMGKMGGSLPEAFNMTVPTDKFFSYGVPVPPNYYAEGGLVGVPVYPQIQTAGQYFSPVYSNTNNAYAMGGDIEEFPQAQRYPQAGWGKTNHFMLGEGGTFPPGMPQYTGMLPVMQAGSDMSGIMSKTRQDNEHFGVPTYQNGGSATDEPDQTFYTNKMNQFMDKIKSTAYNNLSQELMGGTEPNSKYGGHPMPKAQDGRAGVGPRVGNMPTPVVNNGPTPNFGPVAQAPAQSIMNQAGSIYDASNNPTYDTDNLIQAKNLKANAQAMGWGNDVQGYIDSNFDHSPQYKETHKKAQPKKVNMSVKTQAGVSKQEEKPATSTEVTAPVSTSSKSSETKSNAPVTTAPAATPTTVTTTNTSTPETAVKNDFEGWSFENIDGVLYPKDKNGKIYYTPVGEAKEDDKTTSTKQPYDPTANWTGWRRGRFDSRGDYENYLYAVANNLLTPEHVKNVNFEQATRRALFKKNRTPYIKHVTFDLTGDRTPYYAEDKSGNTNNNNTQQTLDVDRSNLGPVAPDNTPKSNTPWIPSYLQQQPQSNMPVVGPVGMFGPYTPNFNNYDEWMRQDSRRQAAAASMRPGDTEAPNELPMSPTIEAPVGQKEHKLMPDLNEAEGPHFEQIMPDGRTRREHLRDMLNSGDPQKINQVNHDLSTFDTRQFQQYDGSSLKKYQPGGGYNAFGPNGYGGDGTGENGNFIGPPPESMMQENPDTSFGFTPGRKRRGFNMSAEEIMTAEGVATNLFNRLGKWNRENKDFNTALQTYGMPRKPNNRGSYLTNDPGVGNTFRPDQYNPNMRGFYAPDYNFAQTGGQQFANMDGDQYYLTQEQINKVIKAGGKVPGF